MARISVANLVSRLHNTSTHVTVTVGFLNRKSLLRGDPTYTALGGAALLTDKAIRMLTERYSPSFEKGNDARFLVADESVEEILKMLERRERSIIELDLDREMREELCGIELEGQTEPILLPRDLDEATYRYVKSVRQVSSESGASYVTYRLFFCYEMRVPEDVFAKLTANPYVRILSAQELEDGRANDGRKVGGNILP